MKNFFNANAEEFAGCGLILLMCIFGIGTPVLVCVFVNAALVASETGQPWAVNALLAMLTLAIGLLVAVACAAAYHFLGKLPKLFASLREELKQVGTTLKGATNSMVVHANGSVEVIGKHRSVGEVSAGDVAVKPVDKLLADYHRALVEKAVKDGIGIENAARYGKCMCGVTVCPINKAREFAGLDKKLDPSQVPYAPAPGAPYAPTPAAPVAVSAPPPPAPAPLPPPAPAPLPFPAPAPLPFPGDAPIPVRQVAEDDHLL